MRKIGLYRGCGVLWAVLLSMLLVSCATKIPVNLNTNLGYGISVDRVGYLSLSTSPVGFEPIGSHVDVSERVSLLIDIMDEITESEPYKQYHSSIRSITLDYDPDTEAVYLKNHWCIVVRPAENQGVERAEKDSYSRFSQDSPGAQTVETKRGKFMVIGGCRWIEAH